MTKQLEMFGSLPPQRSTGPSMPQPATASWTKDERYQIAVAINEDPDQVRVARYLAEAFPNVPKSAMAAIIDDCEKSLGQMGFGGLTALRKELARVHPAYVPSHKTCAKCGEKKAQERFRKWHHSWCVDCKRAYNNSKAAEHRTRTRAVRDAFYAKRLEERKGS